MIEVIEKRTRNSKTHSLGGRKYAYDGTIGSIHYDDNGKWKEIDNIFEPALAPWDWEMLKAGYHIRVKEDFTAGQIIEFWKGGESVQFQPMALEWTNDLDQIQPIAMPHEVTPSITNPEVDLLPAVGMPSHQGTIRWNDGYGDGLDFFWRCTSTRLVKILEIQNLNKLITPEQYIIDGGNPVLRLNLIFDPSSGVDIYVDGELWDRKKKVQTFNRIGFWKNGEELWGFLPLKYWGSYEGDDEGLVEANNGQSIATLEKRGNKLYISIRVPHDWLQSVVYPIFIDTDIDPQPAVVGASADDRGDKDDDSRYAVNRYNLYVAQHTEGNSLRRHVGLRFTGCGILKGSDIDVAYLTLEVENITYDDPHCDIYCEDQESPPNFADSSALVHDRTRTANSAEWAEDSIGGGTQDSPSLISPIQEISTDYGVDTIVILMIGKIGDSKQLSFFSFDYYLNVPPQLHIEYTAAGWTGKISGVVNPAKIAGIAVANIKSVKGVE